MNLHLSCALGLVVALIWANDADAITVANGCSNLTVPATRRAFYVDPATGDMRNDGSAAKPWSTLANVLDGKRGLLQGGSAQIKPGDIIYLRTGDHGNVELNDVANSDFVAIQAEPGQNPTLRSLRINGASKWVFVGLSIRGANEGNMKSSPGIALIEIGRGRGETRDILFVGNTVSTIDDTQSWSDLDWVTKPFLAGLSSRGNCVTISGNHFFNLRNAIGIEGDRTLVEDNKIENFGNDGIDIVASHVTVKGNIIINGRHTKADPLHPDGIQGWTKDGATNTDVVIDGNTIIKTGDPQISEMQGIGIFDGKWDRVTISNNVVVTNHWHGISISGVANGKIINNTVVAFDPERRPTWINVGKAKDGSLPVNVIVRNNITTRLVYTEEGVSADHNIVAKMISTTAAGKPVYFSKPGIYGNNNTVDPEIYSTLTLVDNARAMYDLRPAANSPALRNGSSSMAPDTDIVGRKRVAPIDIGAYAR